MLPIEPMLDGDEGWIWVSFADPERPTGQQFLGVVITEMQRFAMGLRLFGLNPGGEMLFEDIPPQHLPPPEFRNRLLTREEAEAL